MWGGQGQAADLYPAYGADTGPRALMEFAGEGLISCKSSKDKTRFRLGSPRSDLFCHHAYINLRNLLATSLLSKLMFYAACTA
jgi:hypothetical protein